MTKDQLTKYFGEFFAWAGFVQHEGVEVVSIVGDDDAWVVRFRNYTVGLPMKVSIGCPDSGAEPILP